MKKRIFLVFVIVLALSFGIVGTVKPIRGMFLQQPYSFPTTQAVPMYVQYLRTDGAFFNVPNTITTTAATTLTAAQSGSIVYLNAAAGYTVTLPTPAPGLTFEVISQVSQSSGTMKITSGSASIFMQGPMTVQGGTVFNGACNGTTHTDIAMNATTTGGLRGTYLKFQGITSTLWNVVGLVVGSGTNATACDTTP